MADKTGPYRAIKHVRTVLQERFEVHGPDDEVVVGATSDDEEDAEALAAALNAAYAAGRAAGVTRGG